MNPLLFDENSNPVSPTEGMIVGEGEYKE